MIIYQRTNREDQRIFDNLKEALELLKREYGSIERKKYAMSHSDCILFNFQIFDHKAILHDFDNAKVLPSVHDIAEFFVSSCLLNYAGSITNLKLPVFLSCHKKNTKGLIKKIVNELEKDEITLIPICIEIIWLWSLMLGVIKDDYDLNDLAPATENIFERKLSKELYSLFGNSL